MRCDFECVGVEWLCKKVCTSLRAARDLAFCCIQRSLRATAMSEQADVLFKLIVIGDTGTGKSCLLHRFVEGK